MQTQSSKSLIRSTFTCAAAAFLLGGVASAQGEGSDQAYQWLMVIVLLPIALLAKSAIEAIIAALFPHWTAKARTAIDERRGLCVLWGLLLAIFTFVVLLIAGAIGDAGGIGGLLAIPGLIICLAVPLLAAWGFVGPATWMGEQLLPSDPSGPDRTPLRALVGAFVLSAACLVPIVGWALMHLLLFASLGAGLVAMFNRTKQGPAAQTEEV